LSAHLLLRAATRAAHDRVDAAFSRWDLGKRADYVAFLTAQARAFLPIEQAVGEAAVAAGIADWPVRARARLLVDDLADLGCAVPPADPIDLPTPAEALGAAYVLEGSRLGGAMLVKSVAPGLPTRFLSPPATPGHWRAFQALLDRRLVSADDCTRAVAGAQMAFDRFAGAVLAPAG
jgi:heme oxygenase (biliverdin-IX-beta and delta-forming)